MRNLGPNLEKKDLPKVTSRVRVKFRFSCILIPSKVYKS